MLYSDMTAVMLVALAQSYLNITCHIVYKMLSHYYYNTQHGANETESKTLNTQSSSLKV